MGERSQRAEQESNRIKSRGIEGQGERTADERGVEREDSSRERKKSATMLAASIIKKKKKKGGRRRRRALKPRYFAELQVSPWLQRRTEERTNKTRFPDGAAKDAEKAEI